VLLQLRSSGGLKVKPKSLNLAVTGGELDPTTGAGTIETSGAFRAKRGGRKTKVKIASLVLGANGGAGKINARIGKRKASGFGKLSGGTLTRDGWGAKLEGVTARLSSKGAKALRRVLTPGSGRKASAAAGGIKAGKPLGSVSVNAVPKTVEVLPGGTLVFESDPLFAVTLAFHCVNATILDPVGIEPVPPATEPVLGEFIFPVTGGSIAPDFSSGKVITAGGQKLSKNDNGTFLAGCAEGPPVGTSVTNSEFEAQFDLKAFASFTLLPTGPIGVGSLGPFDLAAATTSADPTTKQVTVTGAHVTMDGLSATVFNQVFPNASGDPMRDFKAGDSLGEFSLSVTTH
jgi:hypothetical protein